jgi:hypothetical protein
MSHNYDKFTYDLGELRLTKADKAGLETDFDGPGEYLVCSDKMADEQVKGEILSNLWSFRADFLAGETGLPSEVFSCMQEKMNENCNEAIRALVKSTCGENSLVDAAVCIDGRGHFLASYDSEEISYLTKSGKQVFLYRCN